MSEPIVRDDLPIPSPDRGGRGGARKWGVVVELEPGQSATWEHMDKDEMERFRNVLSSTCHRYAKKLDREYTVRTTPPQIPGVDPWQVGVWRIR